MHLLGTIFSGGLIHTEEEDKSGFGYTDNNCKFEKCVVCFGLFIRFVDNINVLETHETYPEVIRVCEICFQHS